MSWKANRPDHIKGEEDCDCAQCDDDTHGRNPLELPPEEANEEIRRQREV